MSESNYKILTRKLNIVQCIFLDPNKLLYSYILLKEIRKLYYFWYRRKEHILYNKLVEILQFPYKQ